MTDRSSDRLGSLRRWRRPDHQASYDYVRRAYDVPAYVGLRVRFEGKPGRIVNPQKSTPYVHLRLDGETRTFPVHPCESGLEYLAPSGRVMDAWHRHCANRGRAMGNCRCHIWDATCVSIGEQRGARALRSVFTPEFVEPEVVAG